MYANMSVCYAEISKASNPAMHASLNVPRDIRFLAEFKEIIDISAGMIERYSEEDIRRFLQKKADEIILQINNGQLSIGLEDVQKQTKQYIESAVKYANIEGRKRRFKLWYFAISCWQWALFICQIVTCALTICFLPFFRTMVSESFISWAFPLLMMLIFFYLLRMLHRFRQVQAPFLELNVIGSHIFIIGIFTYLGRVFKIKKIEV